MKLEDFLRTNNIKYVILSNYDAFSISDSVDVLILDKDYELVVNKLQEQFDITFLNDICLYGLKKIFRIDSEKQYYFFSRPSIKSIDKMQWVPLNKNVESYFLKNIVTTNSLSFLNDESIYFYLICKNVFNNRNNGFLQSDISFILYKKGLLSSDVVVSFFECTFYKFTSKLIELISKEQFDIIFDEYISFSEY